MRWACDHGVPVPTVLDTEGPDLIMELVEGPTLHAQLAADPSRAAEVGRTLASLHRHLDEVPAPTGWPKRHQIAGRSSPLGLLHGDLHPGNVIQSPTGPVLLDWTNAGVGPRSADVAETWVVLRCAEPGLGDVWNTIRQQMLDAMLGDLDRAAAEEYLAAVAVTRLQDPATTEAERASIHALVAEQQRALDPLRG